jgi:hypothetical protein
VHELDLLLATSSPIAERLAQSLIFDRIPAHADAQSHPTAAKHIHLGGLLGHQDGLALRKDQHSSRQLDRRGERSEITQQHEHFVKAIVAGIPSPSRPGRGSGAEHMVVDEDVFVTQLFDLRRPVSDVNRIVADFQLREDRPDPHT